MSESLLRIKSLLLRYLYLHRRSLIRTFDIVFWPVLDLLIWGFMMLYIQQAASGPIASLIIFIIGAMISWDIHYRGQQAITISLMEEIWTRNIVNILITPIRLTEWIIAIFLYGTIKVLAVTLVLATLAKLLYSFELAQIGWSFIPLAGSLLMFGWSIGMFTAGLLLRFGYAAEAMIWGIPFLVQPFSCVFYPVSVLPQWAQRIALCLPSTYAFEGLRASMQQIPIHLNTWMMIAGLNLLYAVAGIWFFAWIYGRSRATGRLGRLGQD